MKINHLRLDGDNDGTNKVTFWGECESAEDLDDLIAWLRLAKSFVVGWQKRTNRKKATIVKLKQRSDAMK